MEEGNNKNSNYPFPSFLPFSPFSRTSALRLMFHWWNCQSFRDGLTFLPKKQKLSPSATPAKCSCHAKNNLEMNSKQLLFRAHLTDNWKLIYGRRCREIFKIKFRFDIWNHPLIIFSSCRLWSEFLKGTMTGAKCYLTKPSDPEKAI